MFTIINNINIFNKYIMNNTAKYIFLIYVILMSILIYIYIYTFKHREVITNIISILSGSAIALSLFSIISTENDRALMDLDKKKKDNIDYINNSFDKINSFYLINPSELHNLYYEFYGYSNFPNNYNNLNNLNNKITPLEYITLIRIIQIIYIMFIINNNIFEDIYFKNSILNFTRSNKFKEVFSFNQNNYSHEFTEKLNSLKIITYNEIKIENIPIPKFNNIYEQS